MRVSWFEQLFGFTESDRTQVYNDLQVEGTTLRSKRRNTEWTCGTLELVSLAELRRRAHNVSTSAGPQIQLSELVGDAKALHADSANAGALFQVASQFNLLEMISPSITPDRGITIYEHDPTQ